MCAHRCKNMWPSRDSKSCHADTFPNEARFFFFKPENNAASEFDDVDNESIFTNSVESAQVLEAQREVLSHKAAEEFHRRDSTYLGMMRAQKCVSHLEAAAQRETRDYLQRSLYEEFQDERSSMIPGVRRLQDRERQLIFRDLGSTVRRSGVQRSSTKSRKQSCETEV